MGGFQSGGQQRGPAQLPGVFVMDLALLCVPLGPLQEWTALTWTCLHGLVGV